MDLALKFVYGEDSVPILENRVHGVQALSGTGGLRVFGELMRKHGHKHIYVPNPTWGNHIPIFTNSGLEVRKYHYYDAESSDLDFDNMMKDTKADDGDMKEENGKDSASRDGTAVNAPTETEMNGHDEDTADTEEASSRMNDDDGRGEMLYDLYGVVHHQGALSTGHYVASLKSEIDGQWRLFNDAQIFEIHPKDVVDSSAYLLFYIRRDVAGQKLSDFWDVTKRDGEGITEEEMDSLLKGRSDRCAIS